MPAILLQEAVRKWLPLTVVAVIAILLVSCERRSPQSAGSAPASAGAPSAAAAGTGGSGAAAGAPVTSAAVPPAGAKNPAVPVPAGAGAVRAGPAGAPQAGAPQPGASQPGVPQAGAPQTATGQQATTQTQQPSATTISVATATSLMALGGTSRSVPEDFQIGPLGDPKAADADLRAALQTATSFLTQLIQGTVDRSLLSADSADSVSDTVSFGLKRGDTPVSVRVGAPNAHENGEITAAVRLFSAVGVTEGEIYLVRSAKQWLVDDLQINLDQLTVKREKSNTRFFPSPYRWLLQE